MKNQAKVGSLSMPYNIHPSQTPLMQLFGDFFSNLFDDHVIRIGMINGTACMNSLL
jgi:hypothetical protein